MLILPHFSTWYNEYLSNSLKFALCMLSVVDVISRVGKNCRTNLHNNNQNGIGCTEEAYHFGMMLNQDKFCFPAYINQILQIYPANNLTQGISFRKILYL